MSLEESRTICQALAQVVDQHGDADAAVDSESRLTYSQLYEQARRLASLLDERGVKQGDRVALLTVPSGAHLVAWFAVQFRGATPVVLHVRESAEQLAALCRKFDVAALLFSDGLAEVVAGVAEHLDDDVRLLSLMARPEDRGDEGVGEGVRLPNDLAGYPLAQEPAAIDPDDVAVVILSSGTTALPKGIMHSHASVLAAVRAMAEVYDGLGPDHRVLMPYSTAFTGSYVTWLPAVLTGGCCVFLERFELAQLLEVVRREQVTLISLGPTMWRMLLALDDKPETYANVSFANFASEPMDSTTLQRIRETVTPRVTQFYGSTETFGLITRNFADDMVGERLNSVGQVFPHAEFRLLDPGRFSESEVAAGEEGVLVARSSSLAMGVWGDPRLSEELFPTDSLGRRWWRSSDLGRVDEDGFLHLHGRADDMIISGGINIAPAAIEEVLLTHPKVVEAAVVGLPHPQWGQQVTAFVVSRDDSLTEDELGGYLRSTALAGYQVPKQITFVQSLPRTATNKLNRRQLRDEHAPVQS